MLLNFLIILQIRGEIYELSTFSISISGLLELIDISSTKYAWVYMDVINYKPKKLILSIFCQDNILILLLFERKHLIL